MVTNLDASKFLNHHVKEVVEGERYFENVFQSLSRMILKDPKSIKEVTVNGETVYDFDIFRKGKRHPIGLFNELNHLVGFIKGAAEGGESKDRAFVLIGEPGNGKTFLANYLQKTYRDFISLPGNTKYTFRFKNLHKIRKGVSEKDYDARKKELEGVLKSEVSDSQMERELAEFETGFIRPYKIISTIESQTFEDPMILAMNLFETPEENRKHLTKMLSEQKVELKDIDKKINEFFSNYRHLGACTDYILNQIKEHTGGNIKDILKNFVEVVPIKVSSTSGVLTGKYKAGDKITSSAVQLQGDESIERILYMPDTNNPYRYDLRVGVLARSAGGGIHFADEIIKNKVDLINVYLGVIQDREIEFNGNIWPIDTFIIATSNIAEYQRLLEGEEEKPIIDRCEKSFVPHNTNYILQQELVRYSLGESGNKTTFLGEPLHKDPNLNYVLSTGIVLTRMPSKEDTNDKLDEIESMKLAAGESAGEKSIQTLAEIVEDLEKDPDIKKHFGHSGLGHRDLGRIILNLESNPKTNRGKCMFAGDVFESLEKIIIKDISDKNQRQKYIDNIKLARELYYKKVKETLFNAYIDDPKAKEKAVWKYINMVRLITSKESSIDKTHTLPNPQNPNELIPLTIDEKYMDLVEEKFGLKNKEQKEAYRTTIREIYVAKNDPTYDFTDNTPLVEAVVDVIVKSGMNNEVDLIAVLDNQENEENRKIRSKLMNVMIGNLGYCNTCATKTLQYIVNSPKDSS